MFAYCRSAELALPVTRPDAVAGLVPPVVTTFVSSASAAGVSPATQPATTQPVPLMPLVTRGKFGPWGRLELVPIVLELPEEYATADRAAGVFDRWTFASMDRNAAMALMASCGFTEVQLSAMRSADWSEAAGACNVLPPDAVILSLSPECRGAFYGKLWVDPANKSAIEPSWFRVGKVDMRLRGSGMSEVSTALLKSLLYAGTDDTLLFSDIKPALRAVTDPAERMRFLKAVTRKRALVTRLLIDADTDTEALAEYWGHGDREEDVLPLLDSMKFNAIAGVERPSKINIVALLPPFVQERLYRHAEATQPAGRAPDDCYWTAFNFFSETPDDRVHDMTYLAALLKSDYERIAEPSQLGDVILLADAKGDAIHAANYIADDVVFTKNGMSSRQPWILVNMRDILTQYRMKNPDLQVGYFRKR
ncbi:MAG: hypothetical protein JWM57_395 [Phycisphaerales bacterium]|nr:hypothetical protein [Phycisphaerales bacterium]